MTINKPTEVTVENLTAVMDNIYDILNRFAKRLDKLEEGEE